MSDGMPGELATRHADARADGARDAGLPVVVVRSVPPETVVLGNETKKADVVKEGRCGSVGRG